MFQAIFKNSQICLKINIAKFLPANCQRISENISIHTISIRLNIFLPIAIHSFHKRIVCNSILASNFYSFAFHSHYNKQPPQKWHPKPKAPVTRYFYVRTLSQVIEAFAKNRCPVIEGGQVHSRPDRSKTMKSKGEAWFPVSSRVSDVIIADDLWKCSGR